GGGGGSGGGAGIGGEGGFEASAVGAKLRLDGAGADGVAADMIAGVIDGDLAGEAEDAGFGGGVGGIVGPAVHALDGGDVDDGAAPAPDHGGDGKPAGAVDAGEVHIDHPLPALGLGV